MQGRTRNVGLRAIAVGHYHLDFTDRIEVRTNCASGGVTSAGIINGKGRSSNGALAGVNR